MATIDAADLSAEIQRQIDWYEMRANKMKDSSCVLALAVLVGAQKALRELAERFVTPTPEAEIARLGAAA